MTKKKYPKPPKKKSDLLALALGDLIKVERSKKYVVHMGSWHGRAWASDRCAVCFAGSVMAKTLDTPLGREIGHRENFTAAWWKAFNWLDGVGRASWMPELPSHEIPYYGGNPVAFKRSIRSAIKQLRAIGK